MEQYLAYSNNECMQHWPVIKCVRIYGPWRILSKGMVFVDLPGLNDANVARNVVADSYINRCKGIFAFNSTHKGSLQTKTIEKLLIQRDISFFGILETRTDVINPDKILSELGKSLKEHYNTGCDEFGIEPKIFNCKTIM